MLLDRPPAVDGRRARPRVTTPGKQAHHTGRRILAGEPRRSSGCRKMHASPGKDESRLDLLEDYERRCSRWRTRDLVWSYDVRMGLIGAVDRVRGVGCSFIGRFTGDARKPDCPTTPVE
jgi:hypothetical protein